MQKYYPNTKNPLPTYPKNNGEKTFSKAIRISASELNNWDPNTIHALLQQQHTLPEILSFIRIGQQHTLTIPNLLALIQSAPTKPYLIKQYFSNATHKEIRTMIRSLHALHLIKKNKHGWISIA